MKLRLLSTTILLMVNGAIASPSSSPCKWGGATLFPQTTRNKISDQVQNAFELGPYAGLAVGIRMHNAFTSVTCGVRDKNTDHPLTAKTPFPIASISKSFTAFTVHELARKGRLKLSHPAHRYLSSSLSQALDPAITIANLLNHSSGLGNYIHNPALQMKAPHVKSQILDFFRSGHHLSKLEFNPGSGFQYSNTGYYLLGLIIEHVTGMSYYSAVHQTIDNTLGWEIDLTPDLNNPTRVTQGYRVDQKTGNLKRASPFHPNFAFSAGGLSSDLETLSQWLARSTQSALNQRITETRSLKDGTELHYALGALIVESFHGHKKIYHPGKIPGYSSQTAYYPDQELSITVFANTIDTHPKADRIKIEREIARSILGIKRNIRKQDVPVRFIKTLDKKKYEIVPIRHPWGDEFHFRCDSITRKCKLVISGTELPLLYQGKTRTDRHVFLLSADRETRFTFPSDARSFKGSGLHGKFLGKSISN